MTWPRIAFAPILLVSLASPVAAADPPGLNGFDLSMSEVPAEEIRPGGPARDGIPALSAPKVIPARDAPWADDALVLAIAQGGEARAYPIAILDWPFADPVGTGVVPKGYAPDPT